MKKFIATAILALSVLSQSHISQACISGAFEAKDDNDQVVAKIQGAKILDAGWEVYSTDETTDGYNLTRYRLKGSNKNVSLWLYTATNRNKQPGIVWGVWKDAGMIEGFVNFYEIATNTRSIGGKAVLTQLENGRFSVGCQ